MTMKNLRSRRGSASVFLVLILSSMVMTSLIFVHAARQMALAARCDGVMNLAGRSVLSEYDRRLLNEYGLFCFYGTVDETEKLLAFYAGEFKQAKIWADLSGYSMMAADVLEEQILDYMNFVLAQKGMSYLTNLWKKKENARPEEVKERSLVNKSEINKLPSRGLSGMGVDFEALLADGIPSFSQMTDNATDQFRINEYALSHFKYRVGGEKRRETFFAYEVEYILQGKMSDVANRRGVRTDLLLLRTSFNTAHILTCAGKRNAIMTLAQSIAPGPVSPLVFMAMVGGWAAVEAENDLRRLEAGEKVQLVKTEAGWATTIKRALEEGLGERGYMRASGKNGQSYADYLRMLLYLEKPELKLLRMADLIQLNMRGTYYPDFLIKNYHAGFTMGAECAGKEFSYVQEY